MTEPTPMSTPGAGAPPTGPSGPRAGFGSRLGALLVDTLIVLVAAGVLFGIFAALAEEAGIIVAYVIVLVGGIFYYVYFEGGPTGQTLGKRALGIRVVDFQTGGPIGYGRAVGRYFARLLSQLPCYLGYFWVLWDREKQTWHDKLTNVVVVPTSAYPVSRSES